MTFSDILAQGTVEFMKSGGSLVVYLLTLLGIFSIVIGALEKGGQWIIRIFLLIVATPFIFYNDYKRKKSIKAIR